MTTKVMLTIDTEFSIAGAFIDPIRNKPVSSQAVLCEKNGQAHGLGFILDTFDKYNVKGSFFVEALNANYFGHELMGAIAQTIAQRGQDVQLHLHPCWQYFKNPNWQAQLTVNPPNDDITKRSYQEIEALLLEGLDIVAQWGLPRPKAIRTGSLCVNKDVYKAMRKADIKLASNIGVGIFKPGDADLELYSGCHEIDSCLEIPVLTYCDMRVLSKKHLKLLTITGSCWQEIRFLLLAAAQAKLDYVVILTHPSEFVKNQNDQYTEFAGNNINKKRLAKLCQFLQSNPDKFSLSTFSDLDPTTVVSKTTNTLLETPHLFALKRMVENYANDRIGSL
ncbi:MAG: hypothetical protein ABL925_09930 [Methylococcales bacterium]